jgi:hypothetical protein
MALIKTVILITAALTFTGLTTASAQTQSKPLSGLITEFNTRHPKELKSIRDSINNGKSLDESLFSESYKKLLLDLYLGYTDKIKASPNLKLINPRDKESAAFFKSALEKLEYQEKRVDQASDELRAYYADLEAKQYIWKKRFFLDYLSWQTEAFLNGPYETTSLLSTNLGFCPGIGLSYENRFWSFSSDLSGLYGSGGVSAVQGLVSYQQSSVPAYGGKLSLGAARVVASTGSELGLHFTFLYVKQNLETPSNAGYSIDQKKALSETLSLYSRWRFDHFYFQTDFGRYIGRAATLWSLGVGMIF